MPKRKRTVTEYRSYSLPWQFPLLLLSGEHWKISDIPSHRLHFHNCLEIGICHSHSGNLMVFDDPVPFRSGDVTVIPKNVPHTTYSSPGTESLWSYIFFDPQALFQNMLPVSWKNFDLSQYAHRGMHVVFRQNEYPQIYQLAITVLRELEEETPGYQLSARGLLLSLYIKVAQAFSDTLQGKDTRGLNSMGTTPPKNILSEVHGNGQPGDKRGNALVIAPALDFIEHNYSQQFSIDYLADLCRWSPTHFRRVFRDIMHISPLDFLNHTRISNACNLLQSTEDSILDISEAVGFHSVSSFNRCFIKIMRMTPRDYRKTTQNLDKGSNPPVIVGYSGWMRPEVPAK